MALTPKGIKSLKAKAKTYKKFDEGKCEGLYIEVRPNDSKYFRHKFTFDGKSHTYHIGSFPKVTLAEARVQHAKNIVMISDGINPAKQKADSKAEQKKSSEITFEVVAEMYFENKYKLETSESTWAKIIPYFKNDIYPKLGNKPIKSLVANDFYTVLLKIAQSGTREKAKRIASMISRICTYAAVQGYIPTNIAVGVASQLPAPVQGNFKALTKPNDFGKLLKAIDDHDPTNQQSYVALQLMSYIFPRGGDLRYMKWSEFDGTEGTWTYLVQKTKKSVKKDFVCMLPTQAVTLIESMRPITGATEYVFHSDHSRGTTPVVSDTTMRNILVKIGFKGLQDLHGFRASMRTICDEELGFPSDELEVALTHKNPTDKHGGAYARTQFLKQRRVMAQSWADYIDGLRV